MKCQLLILSVLINFVQPNSENKKTIDDTTTEIEGRIFIHMAIFIDIII